MTRAELGQPAQPQRTMKSERALFVLKKVVAALMAFVIGFIGAAAAWMALAPDTQRGDGVWQPLAGLVLAFLPLAVLVTAGLLAAALSLLFHPSVMFRVYWLTLGLCALALGIVWMFVDTFLTRFVCGPAAVLFALCLIWIAFFGSREDVEDAPLI